MSTSIAMLTTISLNFIFLKHPLSMALTLLLKTIMISFIMSIYSPSSWYSYILLLVLIGGLMIIFIYMTSIASNEKFNYPPKILIMSMTTLPVTMMLTLTNHSNLTPMSKIENSMSQLNLVSTFVKFFNNPLMNLTTFMFIILMLIMVASIKITFMKSGTLRKLN